MHKFYEIINRKGIDLEMIACALNISTKRLEEILELENPLEQLDEMQYGEFFRVLDISEVSD